jgi:putative membrane-bound dehydrogenase-like protein
MIVVVVVPLSASAQLPPEEALSHLRPADGIEVSLFASEDMITNPSAIDVDTHGRVWVAEIQHYRRAAKDPPADRIKVLEDTDGDGRADKMTVFAEGLFCPMSVCVAGSKVYVATSPDLWVYDDADGDLKADGPPTKLLTGFGGFNHDHGAHSLVLGPDHKWWMSHGDGGFNVTGTDDTRIQFQWGAMLRGELDGSQLETVAVNFRNPYEICVSSFGESYCSDNDNDGLFSTRICWILEGGNYGWFGRPGPKVPAGTPFAEGWHFRAPTPGFVPGTLVTGFGSPCGMCFYEGEAFGPTLHNVPLHTDAGPREVRAYPHELSGAGMKASSRVLLTSQGDDYFRPDDVCTAPDGSVFVSDWYDGGVGGHAYNNPLQGRIYRLRPQGKTLQRREKPGPYLHVDDALVALSSPNLATQFLARERLIADPQVSTPRLKAMAEDPDVDPNLRARAMWVLDRIGDSARAPVVARLSDSSSQIRALAVRILRRHGDAFASQLLALAHDPDAEVRREVVLAVARLKGPRAQEAWIDLASRYDGSDRYLLEALNVAARGRQAELFSALEQADQLGLDKLQLMQVLNGEATAEYLVSQAQDDQQTLDQRIAALKALGRIESTAAMQATLKIVSAGDSAEMLRRAALDQVRTNLQGIWNNQAAIGALQQPLKQLLGDPAWRGDALALVKLYALKPLAAEVRSLAQDSDASIADRTQAIEILGQLDRGHAAPALEKLLQDRQQPVRDAALSALIDIQHWPVLKQTLTDTENGPLRRQTAQRLVQSTSGALVLLRMIDQDILKGDLRQQVITLAARHPDSNVRVLFERFLPEDERPKRLGSQVAPAEILALEGHVDRGREIFFKSSAAQCKNCHAVQGSGGAVGPDLSQIGRKYERAALLETILDPSKAIAPEYVAHLVETDSGLVYAGFIVEQNNKQLVLKDAQGKLIRLDHSEIEAQGPQPKSLMPELVLRDVTAQDAADLLAFLSSLKNARQDVGRYRVMGPFDAPAGGNALDKKFGPEQSPGAIDLTARFPGLNKQSHGWEIVHAEPSGGGLVLDQVKYSQAQGQRTDRVVNYFLVFADSSTTQEVTLMLGSDDGCKLWVNGNQVHKHVGSRAVTPGEDRIQTQLREGANTILIKVENTSGPGGVSLSLESPSLVTLRTE